MYSMVFLVVSGGNFGDVVHGGVIFFEWYVVGCYVDVVVSNVYVIDRGKMGIVVSYLLIHYYVLLNRSGTIWWLFWFVDEI